MKGSPPWIEHALGFAALEAAFSHDPQAVKGCQVLRSGGLDRLAAHGDFPRWLAALEGVPERGPAQPSLNEDAPRVGRATLESPRVRDALRGLGPWRKGPFSIYGVELDAEWRCFLKWQRVTALATSFHGRRVLDVGSGNGYFLLRLLGAGARLAVGVEPSVLYAAQYLALARSFSPEAMALLPVGIEDLAPHPLSFDSVLSMGVLYHRRMPLDHLAQLRRHLVAGGELVLETLVVDGPRGHCLVPSDRYAQMRNVWHIPSLLTLESWLEAAGYRNLRFGQLAPTTPNEQRSTEWMPHPSLIDFLDREDSEKTVEGHPAPVRVVVVAESP